MECVNSLVLVAGDSEIWFSFCANDTDKRAKVVHLSLSETSPIASLVACDGSAILSGDAPYRRPVPASLRLEKLASQDLAKNSSHRTLRLRFGHSARAGV